MTLMSSRLTEHTRKLFSNYRQASLLREAAEATGLYIPWLSKFENDLGNEHDFHCAKIEQLYEFLSGKELEF